jgi:microcystin-dependent protein
MATTPRWGLPHPIGSNAPDVPFYVAALAQALDNVGMDYQGALADRPSAGSAGRFYFATDTGQQFRDNGSTWVELALAEPLAPVGSIVDYAGATDPAGGRWLICDGREVSRSTYAALFAAIGGTYGGGDGSTTFNLPDFRGRVAVGKGTHADVDALGDNDGIAPVARGPKHSHSDGSLAAANHAHGAGTITVNGHSHTHVYPVALQSGTAFILGPGSGIIDTVGAVNHWDNGGYGVAALLDAQARGFVHTGNTTMTVERHVQSSSTESPGTYGSTAGSGSVDVTGSTGTSGPAYLVTNKLIRAR